MLSTSICRRHRSRPNLLSKMWERVLAGIGSPGYIVRCPPVGSCKPVLQCGDALIVDAPTSIWCWPRVLPPVEIASASEQDWPPAS